MKIVTIPRTAQLEQDGDYGKHFDNVKMEFIRDHVAPWFMGRGCRALPNEQHAPSHPCAAARPGWLRRAGSAGNLPDEKLLAHFAKWQR
ncbi:MAG: hypothetical protein NTW21_26475 [Verrucomicrobia bacterium]|nr:hypothetical protein [Verrucomicrobiota bacterium]